MRAFQIGKLRAAEDQCLEMYGHCMEKSYTREVMLLILNLQFITSNTFATKSSTMREKPFLSENIFGVFQGITFIVGLSFAIYCSTFLLKLTADIF